MNKLTLMTMNPAGKPADAIAVKALLLRARQVDARLAEIIRAEKESLTGLLDDAERPGSGLATVPIAKSLVRTAEILRQA